MKVLSRVYDFWENMLKFVRSLTIHIIGSFAPGIIMFVKNPSEELQLAVVMRSSIYIKHISEPTELVQIMAFRNYSERGKILKYINNPTENVQLMAISVCGANIRYIKNPSERIQLAAIHIDTSAFYFINNPTPKVQVEMMKLDEHFIGTLSDSEISNLCSGISTEAIADDEL